MATITNDCPICLIELEDPYQMPCNHVFCYECIYQRVERHSSCPKCKSHLAENQLKPFVQSETKHSATQAASKGEFVQAKKANVESVVLLQLNGDKIQNIDLPNVRMTTQLDTTVTHVVLDEEINGYAKNTMKYRACVLYGVVIFNPQWLLKSIRAGKLLDTTSYRIKGDVDHQEDDASLKSALARSQGTANIFRGLKVDLYEGRSKEIRVYLRVSKAEIGNHAYVIACDPKTAIDDLKTLFPDKFTISSNWIRESICRYVQLPKKKFILGRSPYSFK